MASRWIRWHLTTHIWEYSTDNGSNWAPLPLNAAIINEGTISSARLPASVPNTGGVNVFTDLNPIEIRNIAPYIKFYETDAPVDQKMWRFGVEAQLIRIDTHNDAGGLIASPLYMSRGGTLTSIHSGGLHGFTANTDGAHGININNSNAGVNAYGSIIFQSNAGSFRSMILQSSSAFTLPGYAVDGLTIHSAGVGGLRISANAGPIDFYTAANKRVYIDTSGNMVVSPGYLYAHAGIVLYGQPYLTGVWTNVPFNAADFTATTGAWTVSAGNVSTFKYALVGKTAIITVSIGLSTLSAATPTIFVKLPYIPQASFSFLSAVFNGAGWQSAYSSISAGDQRATIYGTVGAGGWPAVSGACYVNFQISIPIP
jgi:hypothetical protein